MDSGIENIFLYSDVMNVVVDLFVVVFHYGLLPQIAYSANSRYNPVGNSEISWL